MKWIKKFESKYIKTDKFKNWFEGSKLVNDDGSPMKLYHGTDKNFNIFSLNYSTQGIIWFTSDKSAIERGEVGASGSGYIKELYICMKNPAGWNEYDKLTLEQIQNRGYDGVILPNNDGTFDGFVFNPKQIRIAK